MGDANTRTISVLDRQLTVTFYGRPNEASIVMLHDGLGSISQWRDLPALIAQRTNSAVVVYDRAGHGQSTPPQHSKADWLHTEAVVLSALLQELSISKPLLVGHSDGGSIALIHAAGPNACAGIVALAAHSFVEDVCVKEIQAMRASPGPIVIGLARHHRLPAELFESWSAVWTSGEFRSWDIRPRLSSIDCPVLAVQGDADSYATKAQLIETVTAIGANAKALQLPDLGHVLHHESPKTVVDLVADFYHRLPPERLE